PALYPGLHAWLLLPIAICIGFAATSFGFFVGTLFRTVNQAIPFGSVSIVILSAIGGIWVPIEILPHTMQVMAQASPLHWSLDAVNQVILRNGDAASVAAPMLILIITGSAFWAASSMLYSKRSRYAQ
ncbi:MAG TPA: ABC transporter permease, partial [Chitinophagaceae bacterium]|nr:ABC transporter permease [Chitinophagaceae bacterium]